MRPINDEELLHELDRRMAGHGNGERAARELGVEPRRLREMKSGGRAISLKVAAGLGYQLLWVKKK
jgi:hypothetical protein